MNFVKSSMVASMAIAAINTAVAVPYSHSGLYDIQLDTIDSVDSQPLVASSVPVLTSSANVGTDYNLTRTTRTYDEGIVSDVSIQPEIGVPGQIDFYYVESTTSTTRTFDRDFKKESSSINYYGSVANQNTASSYLLDGSMQRNGELGVLEATTSDSLSMYTRMDIQYTGSNPYELGSMFGSLTINYTDGIDSWSTNYQQEFIYSPNNTMTLDFSDYYNFDDAISFSAIFEVGGTNLSYAITNLQLSANTYASEYGSEYNVEYAAPVTAETTRFLVDSQELPALPEPITAVPVPAALWLFGSGLIGLAGFARRKKS